MAGKNLSRREFIGSAAKGAAGLVGLALSSLSCSKKEPALTLEEELFRKATIVARMLGEVHQIDYERGAEIFFTYKSGPLKVEINYEGRGNSPTREPSFSAELYLLVTHNEEEVFGGNGKPRGMYLQDSRLFGYKPELHITNRSRLDNIWLYMPGEWENQLEEAYDKASEKLEELRWKWEEN